MHSAKNGRQLDTPAPEAVGMNGDALITAEYYHMQLTAKGLAGIALMGALRNVR